MGKIVKVTIWRYKSERWRENDVKNSYSQILFEWMCGGCFFAPGCKDPPFILGHEAFRGPKESHTNPCLHGMPNHLTKAIKSLPSLTPRCRQRVKGDIARHSKSLRPFSNLEQFYKILVSEGTWFPLFNTEKLRGKHSSEMKAIRGRTKM